MTVPSRSRKTAGDTSSHIFVFLSKARDEFISRHSRRSKFAHDNSASVIGNLRRFNRSRAADEPKREERNRSIARTRDIENLSSLRADVVRGVVLLKKHHSVFAERDQDILSLPFLEKLFTSALKIGVFCWSLVGVTPGNACCKECFSAVWLNNCNAAPVYGVSGIGIGCHYLSSRGRLASTLGHQFGCYKALAIVFKNNCIGFFNAVSNRGDCLCYMGCRWG